MAVAIAPDGTWLATAATTGRCGSGTRPPGSSAPPPRRPRPPVSRLAIAPDGTWLATGAAATGRCGSGTLATGQAARHPHSASHRAGVRGGDRPGRHLAGHRQRRRDGADLGHRHREQRATLTGSLARAGARGGDRPGRHLAGHRRPATGRCGSGTPATGQQRAALTGHWPVMSAGDRPGRHLAGHRRQRRDRCGSGTRPPGSSAPPSPAQHRAGRRCWRSPRTAPGWPPAATADGADLGHGHRAGSAPSSPATPAPVMALAIAPDGTWLATADTTGRCGSGTPATGQPAAPPSPATPRR